MREDSSSQSSHPSSQPISQLDIREQLKERALENLEVRLKNPWKSRIDNSTLYAGSPMYFYCTLCHWPSDVLPENYLSLPRTICTECQFLKEMGWV